MPPSKAPERFIPFLSLSVICSAGAVVLSPPDAVLLLNTLFLVSARLSAEDISDALELLSDTVSSELLFSPEESVTVEDDVVVSFFPGVGFFSLQPTARVKRSTRNNAIIFFILQYPFSSF